MCIILTCEKYVRPDADLMRTCFMNNPDGAGIMWCEDGRVQTSKGFMRLDELQRAVDAVPKDSRLVIHMRIATSGGIDVGTCHPFPICDDLDILHAADVECDAAIAHNGVISHMPTDDKAGISDTVSFVTFIVNDAFYRVGGGEMTNGVKKMLARNAPGNRFAVMTKDGQVTRIGSGWNTVTKGIQASNKTWRASKYAAYCGYTTPSIPSWGDWYDWDDAEWELDYDAPDFAYDLEAYDLLSQFCGECQYRAQCAAYGPECDDAADFLDEELGVAYAHELVTA